MKLQKDSYFYDNLRKKEWKITANFGPSVQTRYRIIGRLVGKYMKQGSAIHECGCGSGNLLILLKRGNYKLSGSDFSQEAVKMASRKTSLDIILLNIAQTKIPYAKKYDAVVCSEVLEHIDNDRLAIKNLNNMLVKKGYLFISVPYLMKHWSKSDEFSGHVRRYEPGEMEQKVTDAGFKVVKSYGWGNFIYRLYYDLVIKKTDPKNVMSNKQVIVKKILSRMLYYAFFLDDFFISQDSGRRLFLVAQKD